MLVLIITALGYFLSFIVEPLGFKKYNNSRDILLKSFGIGTIYFLLFVTLEKNNIIENLLKDNCKFSCQFKFFTSPYENNLITTFCILILISVLMKILNYFFLDVYTRKIFLSSGDKYLQDLQGEIVLINVNPNKLYTCVLKYCYDTDDVKGTDVLLITPISSSYYSDNGDVTEKRIYTFDGSCSGVEDIFIKYDDVTQIRKFSSDLFYKFNPSKALTSDKLVFKKLQDRYNKFKTSIQSYGVDSSSFGKAILKVVDELDVVHIQKNFKIQHQVPFEAKVELLNQGEKLLSLVTEYTEEIRGDKNQYGTVVKSLLDYAYWLQDVLHTS
jgi:hypothetical protein